MTFWKVYVLNISICSHLIFRELIIAIHRQNGVFDRSSSQLNIYELVPSDTSRHVTSRHVTSRHVTSRHVTSRHFTSLHVTSRHVTSRHVTSRHVTSRHVTSRHVTSRHEPGTISSPLFHRYRIDGTNRVNIYKESFVVFKCNIIHTIFPCGAAENIIT